MKNLKHLKSLVVLMVLFVVSGTLFAYSVNCDMERSTYPTYTGTAAADPNDGSYWNSLDSNENIWWIFRNMIEADGVTVTPITLQVMDPAGNGPYEKTYAGNAMLNDYWYNLNVVDTLQISGLRPGKTYSLYCYASEPTVFEFGNGGSKAASGLSGLALVDWTEGADHVIFSATADASGIITGTWGGSGYGNFNGLQIVWGDDVVIDAGDELSVSEIGPTSDTYSVALVSDPNEDEVVITIVPDGQVTVDPETLTFTSADWDTAQTVTVTAIEDELIEGAHVGTITHNVASTNPLFNNVVMTTEVQIEDKKGGALFSAVLEVYEEFTDEPNSWVAYPVVLSQVPTSDVSVLFESDTEFNVDVDRITAGLQDTLTFTPANWDVPQDLHLSAVNDTDVEGFPGVDRDGDGLGPLGVEFSEAGWHTSTITYTCSTADSNYDLSSKTRTVYVMDNESYCRNGEYDPLDYLDGDLNFDCYVNIADIALFAQEWLQCTDPVPGSGCL